MSIVERFTHGDPAGRTLVDVQDMLEALHALADGMNDVGARFDDGKDALAIILYEFSDTVKEVSLAAATVCDTWHLMFKDPAFNRPGPDLEWAEKANAEGKEVER